MTVSESVIHLAKLAVFASMFQMTSQNGGLELMITIDSKAVCFIF